MSNDIEKAQTGAIVPANDYGEDARGGFEDTTGADYTIPFLNLLQKNSPEVDDPSQIVEGAEPGMIINSVTRELVDIRVDDIDDPVDPAKGLIFIPCARIHEVVEWIPRDNGGGLVARHSPADPFVLQAKAVAAKTQKPMKWIAPNGNHLVETFYLFGLVLDSIDATEPAYFACVAFNGTKIKHYKDAMYEMSLRPGAPMYSNRLILRSFLDRNKKNQLYQNFDVKFAVDNDKDASAIPNMLGDDKHPLIVAGRGLKMLVQAGNVKADFESTGSAHVVGEDGGEDEVF